MLESKFYMPVLASPQLWGWIALDVQLDVDNAKQVVREVRAQNENFTKQLLGPLKVGGLVLIAVLANLVLVPVVLFCLLGN